MRLIGWCFPCILSCRIDAGYVFGKIGLFPLRIGKICLRLFDVCSAWVVR